MTEEIKPDKAWEVASAELHAGDPELNEAYEELEPAFLVAREMLRVRQELGISQSELARRMGTSQSVISRLERMETTANLRTVHAVAAALGRRLEIRFVVQHELPDFAFGTAEEFVEGITRQWAEQQGAFADHVRQYVRDWATDHPIGKWVRDGYAEPRSDQSTDRDRQAAAGES